MACPLVINKNSVKALAAWWLSNESSLNYVGLTPKSGRGKVYIDMHSPGIIVGMPFVDAILKESSCEIEWHVCEGQTVKSCPVRVATISGADEDIFFCENLIISVLSRASGIATLASRIQSILQEVSWKGTIYMPDRRTPGFGLVEEYAMMISGVSERKASVSVRCQNMDAESLKTAIDEVRSRVGSIPVHVACSRLDEACLAAGAGADILLTGLSAKEILDIATQVKESFPEIQVIASGFFDDSDVKLCATRHVDHLTSLKLCNGYAFVDFQIAYVKDKLVENAESTNFVVLLEENELPSPPKSKSPGPQPTEEVASSIPTPLKKPRLVDDEGDTPKSAKLNGTPTRNTNPTAPDPNWSTFPNAANAQNQKRAQRILRHPQYTPPQRSNVPRSQNPGGLPFFMSNPRLMPPTSSPTRAPAMLLQPGLNINNQVSNVLTPPSNQPNISMRLPIVPPQLQQPPQSMSQRMPPNSPGMLNANQPMGGGFLNNIQPPHNQPPNWQMIPSGPGGHPMGGIGLGMRVGGPGGPNVNNCRSCGFPNPPSMPFCRNCRSGLR
ncbi:unnamed protein product [Schistosoma spindalis]|nr:unnamed protein product [Schistosoma spindale]